MKTTSILVIAAVGSVSTFAAKHGDLHLRGLEHRHLHHKGRALSGADPGHSLNTAGRALVKRTGQCQFPEDAGLVAVGGGSNAGWAMSPDQCCEPGGYCPYACPPGQLSMQWDPKATSYTYPQSMVSISNLCPWRTLTPYRMVDSSVTRAETFKSRSRTGLIASMAQETSAVTIKLPAMLQYARLSFQGTKQCLFLPLSNRRLRWLFQVQNTGQALQRSK